MDNLNSSNNEIKQELDLLKEKHTKKRRWHRIVTALAAVVVFCVSYALILPAITLSCNIAQHTHSSECYKAVTKLVCVTEEHTHSEECYNDEGELSCTLSEHSHADDCYITEDELICGIEEHTHTDSCYGKPRLFAAQSLNDDGKGEWSIDAKLVKTLDSFNPEFYEDDLVTWTPCYQDGDEYTYKGEYTYSSLQKKLILRVFINYGGGIDGTASFAPGELKIAIPNPMYNEYDNHLRLNRIDISTTSSFKFKNSKGAYISSVQNSSSNTSNTGYIKNMKEFVLYNADEINGESKLSAYLDLEFNLYSDSESYAPNCPYRSEYKDVCLYEKTVNFTDFRIQQDSEVLASNDKTLTLDFSRYYVHPWYYTKWIPSKSGTKASAAAVSALDNIPDGVEIDDYVWISWNIGLTRSSISSDAYEPRSEHTYTVNGNKIFRFQIEIVGNYYSTKGFKADQNLITEVFPNDCIVQSANECIADYDEDTGICKIAPGCDQEGSTPYVFALMVGYPKSNSAYYPQTDDPEETVTINNTAKFEIPYTDGRIAELEADASVTVDNTEEEEEEFSFSARKSWSSGNLSGDLLFTSANGLNESWSFRIKAENPYSYDRHGVDIIIEDSEFGIKPDAASRDIIELSGDEYRFYSISVPKLVNPKTGSTVKANIQVFGIDSRGNEMLVKSFDNRNNSSSTSTQLPKDYDKGFKVVIGGLKESVKEFGISAVTYLNSTDSLFDKIEQACGSIFNSFYLTNSAKYYVYSADSAHSKCYTADTLSNRENTEYYKTNATKAGFYYWDKDSAVYSDTVDFYRGYATAKIYSNVFQKTCRVVNYAEEYISDGNGYYNNRWQMNMYLSSSLRNRSQLPPSRADEIFEYFLHNDALYYSRLSFYDLLPPGVEPTQTAEEIKEQIFLSKSYYFASTSISDSYDVDAYLVSTGEKIDVNRLEELVLSHTQVFVTQDEATGQWLINAEVDMGDDAFVITYAEYYYYYILAVPYDTRVSYDDIIKNDYTGKGMVNIFTGSTNGNPRFDGAQSTTPSPTGLSNTSTYALQYVSDLIYASYGFRPEGYGSSKATYKLVAPDAMSQGIACRVKTNNQLVFQTTPVDSPAKVNPRYEYTYDVHTCIIDSAMTNPVYTNKLEINSANLEEGVPNDLWHGELNYIDMSEYADVLGETAPTATFTTPNGTTVDLIWNPASLSFTVPEGNALSGGTLTIDLHDAVLPSSSYFNYYIHMLAPDEHKDGLTSNSTVFKANKVVGDNVDGSIIELRSNRTYVKMGWPLDTIDVSFDKEWVKKGKNVTRPDKVGFSLYRSVEPLAEDCSNGKLLERYTLSDENEWRGSYTGLPVYNQDDGSIYIYTVVEDAITSTSDGQVYNYYGESEETSPGVWHFKNYLLPAKYYLQIVNTDTRGVALENSEFKLYDEKGNVIGSGSTDENGMLTLATSDMLKITKNYTLKQVRPADGYHSLSEDISFRLNIQGLAITLNHGENDSVTAEWDGENECIVLTVVNSNSFELPESGGIGTYPFTAAGAALIFGATLVHIFNSKKRREESAS